MRHIPDIRVSDASRTLFGDRIARRLPILTVRRGSIGVGFARVVRGCAGFCEPVVSLDRFGSVKRVRVGRHAVQWPHPWGLYRPTAAHRPARLGKVYFGRAF